MVSVCLWILFITDQWTLKVISMYQTKGNFVQFVFTQTKLYQFYWLYYVFLKNLFHQKVSNIWYGFDLK